MLGSQSERSCPEGEILGLMEEVAMQAALSQVRGRYKAKHTRPIVRAGAEVLNSVLGQGRSWRR